MTRRWFAAWASMALAVSLIAAPACAGQGSSAVPPSRTPARPPASLVQQGANDIGEGSQALEATGEVSNIIGASRVKTGEFMESRTGRILGRHELGAGADVAASGQRLTSMGRAAGGAAKVLGPAAQAVGYADRVYEGQYEELGRDVIRDATGAYVAAACGAAAIACGVAYTGINAASEYLTGKSVTDHYIDHAREHPNAYAADRLGISEEQFEFEFGSTRSAHRRAYQADAARHSDANARAEQARMAQAEADRQAAYDAGAFDAFMGAMAGIHPYAPSGPFTPIPGAASAAPAAQSDGGQCTPASNIDPATGCHSGHDEQSHAGGCLCASGAN